RRHTRSYGDWSSDVCSSDLTIRQARIALGGVGTKPWRAIGAETALVGQPAGPDAYRAAAEAALQEARPQRYNAFKVELAKRTLRSEERRVGKEGRGRVRSE